jgi:hypothetical protein
LADDGYLYQHRVSLSVAKKIFDLEERETTTCRALARRPLGEREMKRSSAYFLIGGGAATAIAAWWGVRKSAEVTDAIEAQVTAQPIALPPTAAAIEKLPTFKARLTGYWPWKEGLTEAERKMEGGTKDRLGKPLIAIEQHLSDPVKFPYVSVAGDDSIFPYGQRVVIDAWPNAIFRVVDTGGNFRGVKKVYRIVGYEPLDIAQLSSDFKKPTTATVKIIPGDHFAGSLKRGTVREVAYDKFKDQTVAAGMVEGRTSRDREALARALESELGGRSQAEAVSAAWAMRNRADEFGLAVADLLAPLGHWGAPEQSGGYASTRKAPAARALAIAGEVLDADRQRDPTRGAIDFWVPEQQAQLRKLGDVYRAAARSGDVAKARRYARYANYADEGRVRVGHARQGLRVIGIVGDVELLGRDS